MNNSIAETLDNPYYGWLTFQRQKQVIEKLTGKKAGRILDFGCSGGHFLSHFGSGWNKYGCEIDHAARITASQKGIEVVGEVKERTFPEEFFDVITMFAVIEHLENPVETVKLLHKCLKASGLFVVMTGNADSLKAKLQGKRWLMLNVPEHLWLFTAEDLDILIAWCGLWKKIKSLHTDSGMTKIPFLDRVPVLNRLPIFDHYYGYYIKEEV